MAQIILDSNNNLIQGDFDNATLNNRTKLQTTTTNATTNVYVAPNGSATSAGVSVANNSSLTNASKIVMATNGTTDTQIISGVNGSGTYLPLSFYTNNALAMQIDTSQNVGIGTSSPTQKLHVQGGAVLINNGSSAGTVYFVDTNAYINYVSSAMQFGVNSLERMRINSVGSRLYTNFNTGDINTGETTINFSNVSSTTFDISTLFPQVGGTGSGVSINIQVQTWNGGSNSGVSVIGSGARASSSWAWTTINNTNTGAASATVTFSGSGNIVTITFSGGGQYGKAKISLIATS